jgi:hypothetical protein
VIETKLPFAPYEHFTKNSIPERQMLYQKICERIWNVDGFDEIIRSYEMDYKNK